MKRVAGILGAVVGLVSVSASAAPLQVDGAKARRLQVLVADISKAGAVSRLKVSTLECAGVAFHPRWEYQCHVTRAGKKYEVRGGKAERLFGLMQDLGVKARTDFKLRVMREIVSAREASCATSGTASRCVLSAR